MRVAIGRNVSAAVSGCLAVLVACSLAYANPITASPQSQRTTAAAPSFAPSASRSVASPGGKARITPSDLVTSAPVKTKQSRTQSSSEINSDRKSRTAASQTAPEIPWDAIEAALRQKNRPRVPQHEPKVKISKEYQQLIINAAPDLGLEIANFSGPQSIPILDFLRTQSAELSSEIAVYTSDISTSGHNVKMASNGNLDSDSLESGSYDTRPNLIETSDKRPFKLKDIFLWGLGLLVLYTLLDAVFAKLRGPDPESARETSTGDRKKGKRRRRRRTFQRSRTRHKTT